MEAIGEIVIVDQNQIGRLGTDEFRYLGALAIDVQLLAGIADNLLALLALEPNRDAMGTQGISRLADREALVGAVFAYGELGS